MPALILIADADADSRRVYGAMFRHVGADVLEAATADEALQLANAQFVTAAVIEHLFHRTGEPLVHSLCDLRKFPVYVLTAQLAHRAEPLYREALSRGCTAVIAKPYTPRALVRLILDGIPTDDSTTVNDGEGADRTDQ